MSSLSEACLSLDALQGLGAAIRPLLVQKLVFSFLLASGAHASE